jgi:hypothetical protein
MQKMKKSNMLWKRRKLKWLIFKGEKIKKCKLWKKGEKIKYEIITDLISSESVKF